MLAGVPTWYGLCSLGSAGTLRGAAFGPTEMEIMPQGGIGKAEVNPVLSSSLSAIWSNLKPFVQPKLEAGVWCQGFSCLTMAEESQL